MLCLGRGKFVIPLLGVLGLSACQSTNSPPVEAVKHEVKKNYVAEPGLTTKQRFTKALEFLENGEELQAKVELEAYLVSFPESKSARDLLAQINSDAQILFPQDSFAVVLKSGESLSTLAKSYLGSALKFYSLAKYNHISNPSRVNIGQTINIPLTASAIKKREQEKQEQLNTKSEKPHAADVMPEMVAGKSQNEISKHADKAPVTNKTAVAEVKVAETRESVLAVIMKAIEAQDFALAQQKVEQLQGFGQLDKESRTLALKALIGDGLRLSASNKSLAANRFAQAAQLNLQDNDNLAAFDNLKKANNFDPANAQIAEDMLVLQREISDKYHREASSAYRRQELDIAIEKWNKVLEIDPEHSSAKLYRAQAVELKERLKKLNN